MKHSYWIPTNRRIDSCLYSYIQEIEFCTDQFRIDIPVFILDSGNFEIETLNKSAINILKLKYPKLQLYHLTLNLQKRIIESITKKAAASEWNMCFINDCVNYGAVMNRIFILAAVFGFDVIHRRDSDTFLQENCPYPLEFEINYIGKPYRDNEPKVYLIGSSYIGEWNLNIKEFVINDDKLFHTFLNCLNIPESAHAPYMEETHNGCKKKYKGDYPQYITGQEIKLPEAGNFCVYELFRYFPCMFANYTIGTDYFLFKLAIMFGYPFIFHERRVHHRGRGQPLCGIQRHRAKTVSVFVSYPDRPKHRHRRSVSRHDGGA